MTHIVIVSGMTENTAGEWIEVCRFSTDGPQHASDEVEHFRDLIAKHMPNGWISMGALFIRLSAFCAVWVRSEEVAGDIESKEHSDG
jgi:hypothetical protein